MNYTNSILRLLTALVALLPSVLSAQEPPNAPEPFGNIVTPRSVTDEFAGNQTETEKAPAAPACQGTPVEAVVTAARLDHKLAITTVVWLPEGYKDNDVCLQRSPGPTVALLWKRRGVAAGSANTGVAKTFWIDLNDPKEAAFRNAATLQVVTQAGRQSVPVEDLPLPAQD